jgi:hypothetical protein
MQLIASYHHSRSPSL